MTVHFQHAPQIWAEYPQLVPAAIGASGITADADVDAAIASLEDVARSRLTSATESELPEIQAWRRVFTSMGLKPTQYRCASESLLRRFRKEGSLPRIHPLIDLCNAASLAFAVPIAVFDTAMVSGSLEVRHATGDEDYVTFSGDTEHPQPGEVIFADEAGGAHARRWTNRQSGRSAVGPQTRDVLIVAEAVHASAADDVHRLCDALSGEIAKRWTTRPRARILSAAAPRWDDASQPAR